MGTTINTTPVPGSNLPFSTIHSQFLHVAMRTPGEVALVAEARSLTYAELLSQSLAFASRLASAGVVKGALVAVDAGRTVETVVAILGVLFAGGVYVPVQTCEAATPALLTRHAIRFLVAASPKQEFGAEVSILRVNDEHASGPLRLFDLPGEACGLEDGAYVLFTSGSTGARKGVIVPHRGVLRLVNHQTFASMSSSERILLHSPLTFDASTLELWAPLLHGGVVILAPERTLSVDEYRSMILENSVSTLWLTAGLFHLIADHALETFGTLRQLLVGGDVIHAGLFAAVKQRFPELRLVNGYGPTENTTFTCCYVAPAGFSGNTVPIGEPIAGTQVYLLDEAGSPVPDGTAGELAAGGDGVALGYLDDAALTASRFPIDPRGRDGQARMYLTGDIVRRSDDGQLEFLGRKDSEVKLAGQRVQLDDVEHAALSSHRVSACAALTVDEGADKLLIVFVVWRDQAAEEELRSALRERLPAVANPRVIQAVDRLPLTDNGKVDRAQLRRQFLAEAEGMPKHSPAPASSLAGRAQWMQTIDHLWRNVLHRPIVDPNANFFDLGGDSLGLIAMQAALEGLTFHAPSVVELFSLPSVNSIASFISSAESADKTRMHETVQALDREGQLSSAGGRA